MKMVENFHLLTMALLTRGRGKHEAQANTTKENSVKKAANEMTEKEAKDSMYGIIGQTPST